MKFKKLDINNKKELKDFLNLPRKLYSKKDLYQNKTIELQLLNGTHVLSKYINVEGYLLYVNNEVVCRCILTTYDLSDVAYIGLFESVNDLEYGLCFLKNIDSICENRNIQEIVGPVDASFWINYRMKISNFDDNYICEPLNKDYYYDLFLKEGYNIKVEYVSNYMDPTLVENLDNEILEIEQKLFRHGKEYIIENLTNKDKNQVLNELYYLFTNLYNNFPTYKEITKNEFIILFKDMLKIVNDEFVLLAYNKKGELVGFTICLPDYKNLVNNINLFNLFKIYKIKRNPKRVINLYMGVYRKDLGLGKLLTYKLTKIAKEKNVEAIGALIMKGKITNNYFKECISKQSDYVLVHKRY